MRVLLFVSLQLFAAVAIAVGQPENSKIVDTDISASVETDPIQTEDPGIGWFRYSGGGAVRTFDFGEMRVVRSFRRGGIAYQNAPLTVVTLGSTQVSGDSGEWVTNYNFRGVINGLAWLLSSALGGVKMEDGVATYLSPWHYALFAPDFRLQVGLVDKVKIFVGTRTDYMLYRTANTERGIQITPHLGLDLGAIPIFSATAVGVSVSAGYANFWSFDESEISGDLAIMVSLWTTVSTALEDGI